MKKASYYAIAIGLSLIAITKIIENQSNVEAQLLQHCASLSESPTKDLYCK